MLIGGGIGAAIALLFAPKPGCELRRDIADSVTAGFDKTLEAANELKARGAQYYDSAKETGGEVFDVVAARVSVVGEEIRTDVGKINNILASKRTALIEPTNVN